MLKNAVLVSFYIHQEKIAQTLCVEKNIEGSCCQGSCVLQKELQKTDGEDQQFPQQLKERTEIVFCLSECFRSSYIIQKQPLTHVAGYSDLISQAHLSAIEHPPSVL